MSFSWLHIECYLALHSLQNTTQAIPVLLTLLCDPNFYGHLFEMKMLCWLAESEEELRNAWLAPI